MKIKKMMAVVAAGIAMASPLAAKALEFNDGTYKWGFYISENEANQLVAGIYSVCRVDGQKIAGSIVFPSVVSCTVTNELGYTKWDSDAKKRVWVSTRPMKVETLTLPVEEIEEVSFLYMYKEDDEEYEEWQDDPLITSVTIPEGVKYVSYLGSYHECLTNVTSVVFPSTVEAVEDCFNFCDKLTSVVLPLDAWIYGSFVGTPWAQAMGEFFVWNSRLVRYQGTATDVVVPNGISAVGAGAFAPFYFGGLADDSDEMFASATNITSVTLPATLEYIDSEAFRDCEKLAAVNIPDPVYCIGSYAFAGTALTSIALPKNLRSLGGGAFYGTQISTLAIPEGLRALDYACAGMTNLTSVSLPSTVRSLYRTFSGCESLASVVIPSRVKRLDYTFYGCSSLTAIDIPASVERIGYGTFDSCKALTSVTGGAGLEYVETGVFNSTPYYKNAPDGPRVLGPVAYGYKGDLPADLVIPGNIKTVMDYLLSNNDNSAVKTITLSEGVENVGYKAFQGCYNLETVNLGNTVTNLGAYAFGSCSSLATVTGGAALKAGAEAFGGNPFFSDLWAKRGNDDPFAFIQIGSVVYGYQGKCPADVVIPDDVTELSYTFDGDYDESVTNITSITGGAGLRGYVGLYYLDNVKRIGLSGKMDCVDVDSNYALEILDVRNAQAESLDGFCIRGCSVTNLVNVAIGLNAEVFIGEDAYGLDGAMFVDCPKLASLELVCPGHKLIGYEAWTGYADEKFPNDLSTFKYIGYRDFSEKDPVWSDLYLTPKFQKTIADAGSITAFDPTVKSTYAGLLYDADGKFAGSFEVTVNKASKTKEGTVSIKIVPINGKKETIKGTVDANGNGQGGAAGLKFGANGVAGSFTAVKNATSFTAEGAPDATKAKSKTPEADYLNELKGRAWGLVGGYNNAASDFANGYLSLSILMQAKGKAKIAGVLPNGTKVSVTSKILVGGDKCAIPVVFSKSKESLGFVFWVDKDGKFIGVDGDAGDRIVWTGKDGNRNLFTQVWHEEVAGDALVPAVDPVVIVPGGALPTALTGALTEFLPTYEPFKVAGTKWTFAKAPKIKFTKGVFDQAAFDKDIAAGKTNKSGLKLTLSKKDGLFKGTCTIYTIDEKGKLKKNKVTINGVMLNGVGFGSGLIKKIGAMPIDLGNQGLLFDDED